MLVVATHLYISRTLIVYDDGNTDIRSTVTCCILHVSKVVDATLR